MNGYSKNAHYIIIEISRLNSIYFTLEFVISARGMLQQKSGGCISRDDNSRSVFSITLSVPLFNSGATFIYIHLQKINSIVHFVVCEFLKTSNCFNPPVCVLNNFRVPSVLLQWIVVEILEYISQNRHFTILYKFID